MKPTAEYVTDKLISIYEKREKSVIPQTIGTSDGFGYKYLHKSSNLKIPRYINEY